LFLFLKGISPHKLEWLGVILITMGCSFIVMDPASGRTGSPVGESSPFNALVPAMVDIISAVFGAIYILLITRNKKTMPLNLMLFFLHLHLFFLNAMMAVAENPQIHIFSTDPEYGCLGFLNLN
jgi:drug/metabolite transporter (DMT)-like permease